jgi:hypothetical protein
MLAVMGIHPAETPIAEHHTWSPLLTLTSPISCNVLVGKFSMPRYWVRALKRAAPGDSLSLSAPAAAGAAAGAGC